MSGSSKVIVVYPDGPGGDGSDARARTQIQLGFERDGIPTEVATRPDALPLDDAGMVLVGGIDGKGAELLRKARTQVTAAKLDIPIIFAGQDLPREAAVGAGADEVVAVPAYLRDVVTIGRLFRGVPRAKRGHLVGSLAETTGMYTLVRALAALGRSAVLTLVRGLRRGEVRFFHGEVTSAELALIHGQAALHQLLLWTEGRFEYLHEDVVRRQQIPLSHEELFADAERFLEGVRDNSGTLSPSMVLEQDVARMQSLGRTVPTEVHGVLRMFDGHRVLADILEDSPYRVFETLRVAQRAVEAGLLHVVETQRPRAKWRAVLSIEEWLTGRERDEAVERATSLIESAPVSATADTGQIEKARESRPKFKKGKRRKAKDSTPPAEEPAPVVARTASKPSVIDWGALVPRIVGADLGSLSQVVPAAQRSGEISREKLEALDTGARERIFPKEAEPSIVVEAEPEPAADKAAADKAAADKAAADKAAADKAAADKAAADKAAADKRVEDAKAIAVPPPRSSSPAIDLSPRAASPSTPPLARTKSPSAPPPIAIPAIPRTKTPSAPPPITIPTIPRTKTPSVPPAILEATPDTTTETGAATSAPTANTDATTSAPTTTIDAAPSVMATTEATSEAATDAATSAPSATESGLAATPLSPTPLSSIAPTPLASIAAEAPAFLRTPPSSRIEIAFDTSDEPAREPRTKAPSAPPPIPSRTQTPSVPPTGAASAESPEALRARREAEQEAEDARLRAEAVELAKKQAAARAAEQEKQAREALELAQRLAEARAKTQVPIVADEPDASTPAAEAKSVDRSVPVSLETPDPDAPADEEALWRLAEARARAAAAGQETLPVPRLEADDLIRELVGEKITVAETNTSRVVIQEQMTIDRSIQTARIASSQVTTVEREVPTATPAPTPVAPIATAKDGTPTAIDDDPSDGIVRHIPTVETAPQRRPPPRAEVPDDRPGDRTGEITAARKKHSSVPPQNVEPTILIEDAVSTTTADLAVAHRVVAAVAVAQVPAPKTANLAGSTADKAAAQVREDAAIAFSDAEEAFFRQGSDKEKSTSFQMTGPVETFDDLDEDYQPLGFWDRLRGKKPEKK